MTQPHLHDDPKSPLRSAPPRAARERELNAQVQNARILRKRVQRGLHRLPGIKLANCAATAHDLRQRRLARIALTTASDGRVPITDDGASGCGCAAVGEQGSQGTSANFKWPPVVEAVADRDWIRDPATARGAARGHEPLINWKLVRCVPGLSSLHDLIVDLPNGERIWQQQIS